MNLYLDTETTGKWDWSHGPDWPTQPHIVQLAYLLTSTGPEPTTLRSRQYLIKPQGWTISPEAEAVHHITNNSARQLGIPIQEALNDLRDTIILAENTSVEPVHLICHNTAFDASLLIRETILHQIGGAEFASLRHFCIMKALTPIMRLPGPSRGKYKWPTLREAWAYCFPDGSYDEANAHSAMGDVLSCRDIHQHGQRKGWWA